MIYNGIFAQFPYSVFYSTVCFHLERFGIDNQTV